MRIRHRKVRFFAPLLICFITYQQFLCLDSSASKKICNEIAGNYDTNDNRKAVVNDIGDDNVITGMILPDAELYGVVTSSCDGSAYYVAYKVTLGFHFEDCKLFWSNGVSWEKTGCAIQITNI